MYERMLDKLHKPTFEEFQSHCGDLGNLLVEMDCFLSNELNCDQLLRFPYGNSYGWGNKYYIKSTHICDLFAEKNAFTIMLRLTNLQFRSHYDEMSNYTKNSIDGKYPCGEGGWIHYRVLREEHVEDIKKLLHLKVKK